MRPVPITGLQMVEADAQIVFVSRNGRFLFKNAELYDTWNQTWIRSLDALDALASRLPPTVLEPLLPDLAVLEYGHGPESVVAFVDPLCPHCHAFLRAAAELGEHYTFRLVLAPFLGEASVPIARAIACNAASQPERARAALWAGNADGLTPPADCDDEPIARTLTTAQLLGIDGVPFVIAPDGRTVRGAPVDLRHFLAGASPP
jgi:thiol:disulfide interchange protein DsbC